MNGEIETDNANVVCDTRKASDIAAWYVDGWKTHIVDQDEIHADFKESSTLVWSLMIVIEEFDCLSVSGMGSYIGFCGYYDSR